MSELRLSEAMRLGNMMLPPTITRDVVVFERDENNMPCRACALAAPAWAVGIQYGVMYATYGVESEMTAKWPILLTHVRPTAEDVMETLAWWISTLYERRGWTREQIADWVETIEQQQAQPVSDSPVAGLVSA